MGCNDRLSSIEREKLIAVLEADLYESLRVKRRAFVIDSTKSLLKEFGVWCKVGVSSGSVRSSISIFVEMAEGSGGIDVRISDDMAMDVNDALVALMRDDAESANVLCMHYVSGLAEYLIAEKMYIARGKVKALVCYGEGFVGGFLNQVKAA